MPALLVPVRHMLTEDNGMSCRDGLLLIQQRQKRVRWRTARTPFRCKQLHKHWNRRLRICVCRSGDWALTA